MKAVLRFALNHRSAVLILAAILVGLGMHSFGQLALDAVPDITNIQVMVNTKTGGLSPEQVELGVTVPIEAELLGLPRVSEVRSLSKVGLSQVIAVFEDGADLLRSRQFVGEKLQGLSGVLPPGVSPELAPMSTGLGEVYMYTLDAKPGTPAAALPDGERLRYLRDIQSYTVRPKLKMVSGVAEVDTNGGLAREYHVNIETKKIAKYNLTFQQIADNIAHIGEQSGAGAIEQGGQQILVQSQSPSISVEDIANTVISRGFQGDPIRVKDVGNARVDSPLRLGAATAGGREVVLGTVLMRVGANSQTVAQQSHAIASSLALPDDVILTTQYSREPLVNLTVLTLRNNLAEGALLVIAVLFLLLGNFRAALIVTCAIPFALACTFFGMHTANISANLMSLGALDFGLIVDGSVVIIERIISAFEAHQTPISDFRVRKSIIQRAVLDVAPPLFTGLIIIILVYTPLLALEGSEGRMFAPMAQTMIVALLASLGGAILIMPVLALLLLRPQSVGHQPIIFRFISALYTRGLRAVLRHSVIAGATAILLALGTLYLYSSLGSEFVPQLDEGDLVINLARNPGISLSESVEQQKKAEEIIATFPEVQSVFSRLGTPDSATDPMGAHLADTFVMLKRDSAGHTTSKTALFESIRTRLSDELPSQEITATQPIEMRFNEMLEGSRADVSLRFFGEDLGELEQLSGKGKEILSGLPGVESVELDVLTALKRSPVVSIEPNELLLGSSGIPLQSLTSLIQLALVGQKIGTIPFHLRRYPLVVHLNESERNDPRALENLPLPLSDGSFTRASPFFAIRENQQITSVARSNGRRYSSLAINLSTSDLGGFVTQAKEKIETLIPLRQGYEVAWGGQFRNLERAQRRFQILIPLLLLVIAIVLRESFNSSKLAALTLVTIPGALVGGLGLLYLRGMNLSISAAVGCIALSGVAIMNTVVLIAELQRRSGTHQDIYDAVFSGALSRLRAVLMTALVAGLGFIPMAIGNGVGAEIQRPLATVVIGGLVTSTAVTLLVIPSLFLLVASGRKGNSGTVLSLPRHSNPNPETATIAS